MVGMRGEILATTQVLLASVVFFWDIQKSGKKNFLERQTTDITVER